MKCCAYISDNLIAAQGTSSAPALRRTSLVASNASKVDSTIVPSRSQRTPRCTPSPSSLSAVSLAAFVALFVAVLGAVAFFAVVLRVVPWVVLRFEVVDFVVVVFVDVRVIRRGTNFVEASGARSEGVVQKV